MEKEDLIEEIYQFKVKFSSVGFFHKKELHDLIISGLQTPFILNEAGEWIES